TAENGAKACQILQHNNFDVVITDCSMPVMDGYELAAHIRQDPALKDLIVIGCTADAREESAARCIDAGMNACMIKPVAIDTLQATLLRKDIVSQIANTNHSQSTEDND
ncbi:response regulator, partial [Leptospira borgpetersenii serovar Ballum]|nr:response regulator [Leptospira borgpetersenii serovar Ballum]